MQQALLHLQLCHMGLVAHPIDVTQPPCMPDLLLGFDGLSDRLVGALLGVFDGLLGRRPGGFLIARHEQKCGTRQNEFAAAKDSRGTWMSRVNVQYQSLRK